MDFPPFPVTFNLVLFINHYTDYVLAESCTTLFWNSSSSQYKIIYLYCSSGCCEENHSQFCCSSENFKNAFSTGQIFGIAFGVIISTTVFLGCCICVIKLCIIPNIRQYRRGQNSSQETTGQETELDNMGQHNGIAIISGTNSLPKYEDLPPSYEDVIHGRVNLSFIKEEASPIQTTTSEHVNNPNS
ncbi:uncharacterized protein LOC143080493 [Mytilus galloprovincialis]|uniref:uncharacterized protein LOC143080493 n=1 Tax=Mytilus galloprovincialis TaxID=29158 RepID=UPI003F7C101A